MWSNQNLRVADNAQLTYDFVDVGKFARQSWPAQELRQ